MQDNKKNSVQINLEGKVALVTGANKGLGFYISKTLAEAGAHVFAGCRDLEQGKHAMQECIDSGLSIELVALDVTDQQSVDVAVDKILDKQGKIDILVNNAGVLGGQGWEERLEENAEDWEMNYEVNLRGVARMTDAVVKGMKEKQYGKIINIASNAGRGGNGKHIPSSYGATKAAVINLTQTNALSYAADNINVNCVCPGIIWTPMLATIGERLGNLNEDTKGLTPEEVFAWQAKTRVPLKRGQTGEDIGYMTAFLASELSRNITGQSINVNGGIRMN